MKAGLGHLFRCLNIAKELRKKKIICIFILEKGTEKLNKFIKKNVGNVHFIKNKINLKNEMLQLEKQLEISKKKKFFLIDGYNFNLNYQKRIQKRVDKLILISDIPNSLYFCDILINPSIVDNTKKYKNLVQKKTSIYSGKKYILINNYNKRDQVKIKKKRNNFKKIKKVIISFGGNTNSKLIFSSLNALYLSNLKDLKVYITTSKDFKLKIPNHFKSQFNIVFLKEIYNLDSYYKICDLAIGSCGHSTWERSVNMIPSICINLAKNQNSISNLLLKTKSAFVFKSKNLKLFEKFIVKKINFLNEKKNYLNLSNKISCLVQKKPLSNLVNKIIINP